MARLVKSDNTLRYRFEEYIKEKQQTEKEKINAQIDNELPSFISWAVKPIVGLMRSSNQLDKDLKGSGGEFDVWLHAKLRLSDEWIIMNDVVIEPEPEVFAQNDHIIIGPPGLFIVETKAWEGSFTGYKDQWKMRQGNKWEKVSSPTIQNKRHHKLTIQWLNNATNQGLIKDLPEPYEIWVEPIVCFTNAKWIKTNECSMPVLDSISKLINYLKDKKDQRLTAGQVNQLSSLFAKPANVKPLVNESKLSSKKVPPKKKERSDISELTLWEQKTTKDGKKYVRITADFDKAKEVYESFKQNDAKISELKKDKYKANTYYFYIK